MDLVVRVTLVQRLGLSATDIIMHAPKVSIYYFGVWVPILREGYHIVALPIEETFPFTECPFLSSFYYNRYIVLPMIVLCGEN